MIIQAFDDLAFESLADFKWHVVHGCEVMFLWKEKCYSITHPEGLICVGEGYYSKDGKTYNLLSHTEYDPDDCFLGDNIDDAMNYVIDGDRLGDIATKIGIVDRTTWYFKILSRKS